MIPKKASTSLLYKARNLFKSAFGKEETKKSYIWGTPSDRALINSEFRFQEKKAMERRNLARELTRGRLSDTQRKSVWWNASFSATLKQTNLALGVDLEKFVREHAPNGRVLEIGCGSGKTISELQKAIPSAHFSALGLTISKGWMKHSNYKKIDWHVAHMEKLSALKKSITKESVNIVFSSLGFTHAPNPKKALQEIHSILSKGGHLILNIEKIAKVKPIDFEKAGFEIIWEKKTPIEFNTITPQGKKVGPSKEEVIAYCLRKK